MKLRARHGEILKVPERRVPMGADGAVRTELPARPSRQPHPLPVTEAHLKLRT